MNAALLKRLFGALQKGQGEDVAALCSKIVESEKRRGHKKLAAELERLIPNGPGGSDTTKAATAAKPDSRALAPRQWDCMYAPHFGLMYRDSPKRFVDIEISPFGIAQFPWTHKDMRE